MAQSVGAGTPNRNQLNPMIHNLLPVLGELTGSIQTGLAAIAAGVGIGLIGTWRILGQKAAPFLREL